jgi:hypothetical protein
MGKRGQEARERRGFGWLLNGGPAKRHQTDADTNGNRQGAPSPGERVWVLHAGAGCRSLYWAARQVLRVYLDSGRRRGTRKWREAAGKKETINLLLMKEV